jgi:hypothetical protein
MSALVQRDWLQAGRRPAVPGSVRELSRHHRDGTDRSGAPPPLPHVFAEEDRPQWLGDRRATTGSGGALGLAHHEPVAVELHLRPVQTLDLGPAQSDVEREGIGHRVARGEGGEQRRRLQVSASSRAVVLSSLTSVMSAPPGGPLSSVPSARVGGQSGERRWRRS